jgi:transposase InsO family protein
VCELHATGDYSLRQISALTGLSLGSVQNYLSSDGIAAHIPALDRALELRRLSENQHRGALELRAMVASESDVVPSARTIERAIACAGLARKGVHRSSARRPYHMEARPTSYGQMFQMDTVKFRVGSLLLEYLSVRDVYSGCHLLIPHNPSQDGMLAALARIRGVYGLLPRVFQTDNGTTDFSMARRNLTRPWHRYAFSHGVERVQYIPEAEPRRNGAVESFHDWIKDELANHGAAVGVTAEIFDSWLLDRLHYYNTKKPLGSTKVPPASLSDGRFNLGADSACSDYDPTARGTFSFIRYVHRLVDRTSGAILTVAVVRSPATIFVVPPEFEGGYLRIDYGTDGLGQVVAPAPADVAAAMMSGEKKKNGRFRERGVAGRVVAAFVSPFIRSEPIIEPTFDVAQCDGYTPIITDVAAIRRAYGRILKQAVPTLTADYDLRIGDNGEWEAWRSGELVWTEQSSPAVIEHAAEVL